MNKWLPIWACAGLLSCAVAPPSITTISDLGQVPSMDRNAMPNGDGGALRSAALKYYAQGTTFARSDSVIGQPRQFPRTAGFDSFSGSCMTADSIDPTWHCQSIYAH